ncbi:MAG TPA: hypothetical protein DCE42_14875 [Myxococcales bacterium]|nr:hypothetical protein [Deltaproteobacteria bacterium]MBU53543.1 hypothetical protein [Deltaproteobacteria bacterium]HAA56046.1 hypothetical protein [Myxococcales bacterium]
MVQDEFSKQLRPFLVAPYPYVYLVTQEEDRALTLLREEAEALDVSMSVWRPEEYEDPAEAFDVAIEQELGRDAPHIAVFVDPHPYLDEPARLRRLRVLASLMRDPKHTCIFLSPVSMTPSELAADWNLLYLPLPAREQLEGLLNKWLPEETFPNLMRERLSSAALGLSMKEADRAFARTRAMWELTPAIERDIFDWEAAVVSEKSRLMQEGSALEFCELDVDLEDVGGLDELKQWVFERREAFSEKARAFGLPQPKGLLLLGVQGCGKSLAAKAVAGYWGLPLLRFELGAAFSGQYSPDQIFQRALQTAESMAPAILWVDEIEKGLEGDGDGDTSRLLGSLLVWLQEKKVPVFFVATANRVHNLPPELLRRGRFDEIFFVDLPDTKARKDILSIHLRGRGRHPSKFGLSDLAGLCEHYSGAELEQVVVAGLYRAFAQGRDLVQEDLELVARQMVPLYATYEEEIKALRSWAQNRARTASKRRKLVDLFRRTS